jgi:hypothetical protein
MDRIGPTKYTSTARGLHENTDSVVRSHFVVQRRDRTDRIGSHRADTVAFVIAVVWPPGAFNELDDDNFIRSASVLSSLHSYTRENSVACRGNEHNKYDIQQGTLSYVDNKKRKHHLL